MLSAVDEKTTTLNVLWHWSTMGPYHFARMHALRSRPGIALTIAETSSIDDHEWVRGSEADGLTIISPERRVAENGGDSTTKYGALWELRPDIVVAPGYADPQFLAALTKYREERPDCIAILWSESTMLDHKRHALIEAVKTCCISAFDGAIVAGTKHAAYLSQLGMPRDRIAIVGNCVDNNFFSSRTHAIRSEGGERVPPYFLFVGRLIPEKNVSGLLEAYELYRGRIGANAWSLVLVGGGQLEARLKQHVLKRNIPGITFAGVRQVNELPAYYAHASCLVLPSTSEPWGLVVNEAMACGLPVLVSNRCGCSPELVREGVNGFTFDPFDANCLAALMERVSTAGFPLDQFGINSRNVLSDFTPDIFAEKTEIYLRTLLTRRRVVPPVLKSYLTQAGIALWSKLS
jgi:1,2-diacylglycerol 3-alpha-glucosyltransferase